MLLKKNKKRLPMGVEPLTACLWSGGRGSNPQQPVWKTGTLPIELPPHTFGSIAKIHILL